MIKYWTFSLIKSENSFRFTAVASKLDRQKQTFTVRITCYRKMSLWFHSTTVAVLLASCHSTTQSLAFQETQAWKIKHSLWSGFKRTSKTLEATQETWQSLVSRQVALRFTITWYLSTLVACSNALYRCLASPSTIVGPFNLDVIGLFGSPHFKATKAHKPKRKFLSFSKMSMHLKSLKFLNKF